ncbi:MAG TPA: metallophosphoesterase [Candidatus Acidoferrum sp.]|nr:metallophosphoesterase [Candidatus Acidoferrum sp.]
MKLAWATDVHLDLIPPREVERFADAVAAEQPDALALSGDIAEAPTLEAILEVLAARLDRPIYFVLGNHDFYRGDIASVRARAAGLAGRSAHLVWLPAAGVVPLSRSTALVGVDGWGDGRLGDFAGSRIDLADWVLIADLRLARDARLARLRALGDESAAELRRLLGQALAGFEEVVVVTHVPPFREAAWHEGRPSDDQWLPWFSCAATGEVLLEAAASHPDRAILVLCGHTHGSGEHAPAPGLRVLTGGATYGAPELQRTFLF